ncbi:uncharacterized protein LOC101891209 [Musca domestica]|uniref:Uncharacterized protein LOC101891209 n=1 Tax=Musca domestica TaxID=7370 RepID=A0A1I8MVE5_MUSDO|nr:uncharacterized protein LOC101891209 [Musca domestica]
MPSRRTAGSSASKRRKHSLGNLRRAHPASGATWNVQVVRGKMSSKCLWHACRALILGVTLLLLGAGMATLGYYADYLSIGSELRGNATVRVKNDLKGFHLNNFSYVGPIVMGFGGFIVVASCVMTFEARDSAAKVVPARFRAGVNGSKITVRSNQSSSASQRRAIGLQYQTTRWDQQFGVFRSSPATEQPQATPAPFDREALTAELIKFSKTLSASARFSPKLRRLSYTGSVPNLSTHHASSSTLAYSTNISHLLSPNHKTLLLTEHKRHRTHRHHHHHHHHSHHHNQRPATNANSNSTPTTNTSTFTQLTTATHNSGRQVKNRGTRISNSLIQRATRESTSSMQCALLQPPNNKLQWHHAASFDESCRVANEKQRERVAERTKRSDTAKRHVLARQKPIEHEEDKPIVSSPLGNRRCSTMSDSSYSGRWTVRCASIASRTSIVSRASSIDSRRIQVDLHSPEVVPKSILRSPKRYSSGPSTTPSVEKEFRSQLSVCSEPPAPIRQLSGQSSLEPCLPEEGLEHYDENLQTTQAESLSSITATPTTVNPVDPPPPPTNADLKSPTASGVLKKARPDSLPLMGNAALVELTKSLPQHERIKNLHRSHSSRTYDRPRVQKPAEHDDSIFYIRSDHRNLEHNNDFYDQIINERRSTLLKADSETALAERKQSSLSIPEKIMEQCNQNSTEVDADTADMEGSKPQNEAVDAIVLQIEEEMNAAKTAAAAASSSSSSDPLQQV